jgi:hypothetical protein
MGKRSWAVMIAATMCAGVLSGLPASAQEAPPAVVIPEVVQIDDPGGDANYLNDQALLNNVPPTHDNGSPADAGTTSDLMKIWYSTTADTVSVNIQLEGPPPSANASYIYRVFSNPGEGSVTTSTLGCLRFFAFMPSATPPVGAYSGPQYAGLLDYCDKGTSYTTDAAEGVLTIAEAADGTAVMTITVPRSYSEKLADGQAFTTPTASVQNLFGTGTDGNGQPIPATDGSPPSGNWRRGPQIDDTILGTDFILSSPEIEEPGTTDPPGKGKKKGCKKGKGKKKGACPKPSEQRTVQVLGGGSALRL